MLCFDGHFESEGPADRPAFQLEAFENGSAEHLAHGRGIAEWRPCNSMEQPVGSAREESADERADYTPPSVGVASATDEIAGLTNQREHVVHDEHWAGIVRAQDGNDVAVCFGHACTDGIDNALAELVVHTTQARISRLRLPHNGDAAVVRRVVD